MIRRAGTDADLAAWCAVWTAITPREPSTLEQVKRRLEREPERLYLIAEKGGRVVGAGFVGPSQSEERTAVSVRVLSESRRHGVGSALFEQVLPSAAGLGRPWLSGMVFEDDPESVAWVERRGFEEYGRQIELARVIGDEDEAVPPDGIELRQLDDEYVQGAYAVAVACFPDMAVTPPIQASPFEQWLEEEIPGPVTVVALDADRVVGYAALIDTIDGLAEHGLTAVLRSHRGRGIATALKQWLLRWAGEHGYRELSTWTQDGNDAMQAVNVKLGYRPRPAVINVRRRA